MFLEAKYLQELVEIQHECNCAVRFRALSSLERWSTVFATRFICVELGDLSFPMLIIGQVFILQSKYTMI